MAPWWVSISLSLCFTLMLLVSIGLLADQSPRAGRWEMFRLFASLGILGFADVNGLFNHTLIVAGIRLLATSSALCWLTLRSPLSALGHRERHLSLH